MTDRQMTPDEVKKWTELAALEDHRKRTAKLHGYFIQRQYGITSEQYEYQLARQNGACAICKEPPAKKRLAIDHDNASGKNRGLLCTRCNVGLGYFRDNPKTLQSAIDYINNFQRLITAVPPVELDIPPQL